MKPSSLKSLCQSHAGKFAKQTGIYPGQDRDYWLIFESFQRLPMGTVTRSAQIQRSWAMQHQQLENSDRTLHVYSLVFITRGKGTFLDALTHKTREVNQGDLLCLFPGIAHRYVPAPNTTWDEINIEFSGPVFDTWMGRGMLDAYEPVRNLADPGDEDQIKQWLQHFYGVVLPMEQRALNEPDLNDVGRMLRLIAAMCATWQSPVCAADTEWANLARQKLLECQLDKKLDLKAQASQFGVSEQTYRKKFKRLCGISPCVFHFRHQVQIACSQLISTNKPIKEISYDVGFASLAYFSRRFKQVTGASPLEYRNKAHS